MSKKTFILQILWLVLHTVALKACSVTDSASFIFMLLLTSSHLSETRIPGLLFVHICKQLLASKQKLTASGSHTDDTEKL